MVVMQDGLSVEGRAAWSSSQAQDVTLLRYDLNSEWDLKPCCKRSSCVVGF